MDVYFFILTAINLFVLIFMCMMVRQSETLAAKQIRWFLITFVLIGGISILEMISVLVNDGPGWLRPVNILSNYLGFALTPAVPICLVYTTEWSSHVKMSLKTAVYAEIMYIAILTISLFNEGLVFSVDAANHYSREPGFWVYMLMYYLGIGYLLMNTLEMAHDFQNRGRELIYGLAGFIAVGTLVQILLPDIHITWLCVTLIAVLFFLYCNEMWNQLDGLTGLLSQKSYLNRTMNPHAEDRMMILFDVDNFKQINDTYGHQAGDRCLKEIAMCLKKSFSRYGSCYRIGGDEFCVFLHEPDKEAICREKFYAALDRRRKAVSFLPGVSCGSAERLDKESIDDTKKRADQRMYENKKERKALNRR